MYGAPQPLDNYRVANCTRLYEPVQLPAHPSIASIFVKSLLRDVNMAEKELRYLTVWLHFE